MDGRTMVCPACGAQNADTADTCFKCGKGFALTEGALLASRYEILSFLGRGGMGIVYKARDHALEEMVALKVLRFDIARTGDVARRFRSEIKLARKVRHPNVCGIHEYGEDGIHRFIVMELIEGRDLRWLLQQQGAFRPEEACALAIEVSEGLQAIHDVGIVHRDLKTPNIMLDARGRVRLMDFGIAKQQGEVTSGAATATGMVLGTPEYMSPEQARGRKVDFRSDIYALGVIGYELFTGHVPFKGETPLETLFKHLQEAPVFAGPEAPGIPEAVVPVLRKALAKVPEERFATAREMAAALRAARAESFGVSSTAMIPPVLAATPPGGRETRQQTQTIPTPAPDAPPTVRSARTASPEDIEARAPTPPTVRSPPTRPSTPAPPAVAPTRIVGEGRRTLTGPPERARPGSRRRVWLVAGASVAVGVAGILWLVASRTPTGSPEETPPVGEAATPEPGPAATSAAPSPAAPAARSEPGAPGAAGGDSPRTGPAPEAGGTPEGRGRGPRRPSSTGAREAAEAARPAAAPVAAPRPTPPPAPQPTPPPTPTPPPPTPEPVVATGLLQLLVLPWAEVAIDEKPVGTTPMRPLRLDVGEHRVVLTHPEYKPLLKRVQIRADQTTRLEVDLGYEAFPLK